MEQVKRVINYLANDLVTTLDSASEIPNSSDREVKLSEEQHGILSALLTEFVRVPAEPTSF